MSFIRTGGKAALPASQRSVVFLVTCLTLVYGMFAIREYKAYTFALYDPGWMVSTVMSIVEDGDLDLRNQLKNDPNQAADQTSLGKHGEWYPLHEILMPLATAPFYFAFGINGCLVFNLAVSILLMIILFDLCARHVDHHSAFTATVLTAFPTLFLHYSYCYSLDVFSAFMLVSAYWCAVKHRYLLAGLVWGLAFSARLANAVTIIGFLLFLLPVPGLDKKEGRSPYLSKLRPALLYLLGALPVGISVLVTNWLMYGSPAITSYDRWQHFVDGQGVVSSQRGALACSLVEHLPKVLLDQKSGLVVGAPLILLALAFGMRAFWKKARNEAILLTVTCGSLIVLFSKYCDAHPGEPGNRYLMPVVALCAIPLSMAVQSCFAAHTTEEPAKND